VELPQTFFGHLLIRGLMLDELQLTLAQFLQHEPSSLKFTQWMRSEMAHESLGSLEYFWPR
jgi:hypothetical protein